MQKLSKSEITELLNSLNSDWVIKDDALHRDFLFDKFKDAFAFMTSVAELAEKQNHHPDWCNSFKQVNISITTHDVGGLTNKDFNLAKGIESIFDSWI